MNQDEYELLKALGNGLSTEDELAKVIGSDVNPLLGQLISQGYVNEMKLDGRSTTYGLSPGGAGRLVIVGQLARNGQLAFDSVMEALAVTRKQEDVGKRDQLRTLRLTDQDRTACSTALAEQFGLGRIDAAELSRRTDLLFAAQKHAELDAVFEGLPTPSLYGEAKKQRPLRLWLALGFGVAAALIIFGFVLARV
jgi:hypothetical protein